jgi:hypothetical protein
MGIGKPIQSSKYLQNNLIMAVTKPDELQHNNPDLALVDSRFIRGGYRSVVDLAALYTLATKTDQLKQNVTAVYVQADGLYYRLVDINNIGNATGWKQTTDVSPADLSNKLNVGSNNSLSTSGPKIIEATPDGTLQAMYTARNGFEDDPDIIAALTAANYTNQNAQYISPAGFKVFQAGKTYWEAGYTYMAWRDNFAVRFGNTSIDLSGFVPYNEANANINIGPHNLHTDALITGSQSTIDLSNHSANVFITGSGLLNSDILTVDNGGFGATGTGRILTLKNHGVVVATVGNGTPTNPTDLIRVQDLQSLGGYEQTINKNIANGYAGLNSAGLLPFSLFPDKLLGNVKFKGTYDGAANIITSADSTLNSQPLPVASSDNQGYYFISTTAYSYNGYDFKVGDWIISNGDGGWSHVENSDAVTTVFGRNGNIIANAGDYAAFYALLNGNNIYTGDQTVTGNITSTRVFTNNLNVVNGNTNTFGSDGESIYMVVNGSTQAWASGNNGWSFHGASNRFDNLQVLGAPTEPTSVVRVVDLGNYVPYNLATQNVNLGSYGLTANSLSTQAAQPNSYINIIGANISSGYGSAMNFGPGNTNHYNYQHTFNDYNGTQYLTLGNGSNGPSSEAAHLKVTNAPTEPTSVVRLLDLGKYASLSANVFDGNQAITNGGLTVSGAINSNTFIGSTGGFGTASWSISENASYVVNRYYDASAPVSPYALKFRKDGTGTLEYGFDSDVNSVKVGGIFIVYAALRAYNAPVDDFDVVRKVDLNTTGDARYLQLTGGALTGTLNSRNVIPSTGNTYSLGNSGAVYTDVFARNMQSDSVLNFKAINSNSITFTQGATEIARFTSATGNFILGGTADSGFKLDIVTGTFRSINASTFSSTVTIGTATVNGVLSIAGTYNSIAGLGRGQNISSTLVATANNDTLIGLDINPTFTNGAFTGVNNYALRVTGNTAVTGNITPLTTNTYNLGASSNTWNAVYATSLLTTNLRVLTTNLSFVNAAGTTFLGTMFNSTGNLLISTGTQTDGGFKLDVQGTARFTGATTLGGSLTLNAPLLGTYNRTVTTVNDADTRTINVTNNSPGAGFFRQQMVANAINGTNTGQFDFQPWHFESNSSITNSSYTAYGFDATIRMTGVNSNTTTGIGSNVNAVVSSGVNVTNFYGFSMFGPNPAGTITNFITFQGAGGTSGVTNYIGLSIGDGTASSYFGVKLSVASGSGKYNIYSNGTALNYLQGSTIIGTSIDSGYKLDVIGSLRATGFTLNINTTSKTANYSIVSTDDVIQVDSTSGVIAVTVPTAVGIAGKTYTIKRVAGSNAVNITSTSSQTFDSAASPYVLSAINKYVTIISNGANWLIIANN